MHKLEIYTTTGHTIQQVVKKCEEWLKNASAKTLGDAMGQGPGKSALLAGEDLLKLQLVSFRIDAGLPRGDYGQTVELMFSSRLVDEQDIELYPNHLIIAG